MQNDSLVSQIINFKKWKDEEEKSQPIFKQIIHSSRLIKVKLTRKILVQLKKQVKIQHDDDENLLSFSLC